MLRRTEYFYTIKILHLQQYSRYRVVLRNSVYISIFWLYYDYIFEWECNMSKVHSADVPCNLILNYYYFFFNTVESVIFAVVSFF